ncbi:FlgO family outer membrane protein [Desulfomicrobium salsuginis]
MTRAILLLCALFCAIPAPGTAGCGASRIEELCTALADSLAGNLQVRLDRSTAIMTAPFADLNDLRSTSPLGRILAEETGNAFARHGYRVADTRAFMPSPYSLKENGETALSGSPDQAGSTSGLQAVLTGTYTLADGGVRVSARIVQTADHVVLASASCRLRLTEEVHILMGAAPSAVKTKTAPAPLLDLKHKSDAKRVQQALAAQGLYKGKIDGAWGKRSKAALARFRASLAMPAAAQWDRATQDALLPPS